MEVNFEKILVAILLIAIIYKIFFNRENFDGTPIYATFGTLLVVGIVGYLIYNLLWFKKLGSFSLVR